MQNSLSFKVTAGCVVLTCRSAACCTFGWLLPFAAAWQVVALAEDMIQGISVAVRNRERGLPTPGKDHARAAVCAAAVAAASAGSAAANGGAAEEAGEDSLYSHLRLASLAVTGGLGCCTAFRNELLYTLYLLYPICIVEASACGPMMG